MAKPYISVLERDMRNPEYRKQMEEEQALERVYPEQALLGVRLPAKVKSPKRDIKIGENVADYNHPAWKNVALPSKQEQLKILRQKEAQTAKAAAQDAAEAAVINAEVRGLNEPYDRRYRTDESTPDINWGYKKGGKVKSASARADGIAQRGKTRGRIARHG